MSGPWDRPSSDDPGAQWPSEDLGQSSGSGPARDPATEGAPGWDDWPAAPPPDDYLIEEPLPPSSDPWAESWTEEEADAMLRSSADAPVAEPRGPDAPAAEPERPPAPAPEPEPDWRAEPAVHPEPASEPVPEAEPAQPQPAQPQPSVEPSVERTPRVEPWSPDPDPWRFEPEPAPEPAPEPVGQPEPITAQPEPEADAQPAEADLAPAAPRWPSRSDELPDWLAEPMPSTHRPETADERPEPEGAPEPAAEPEPVVPAQVPAPEPEGAPEPAPEPEPMAPEPEPTATAEPEPTATPEPEPTAETEPDVAAAALEEAAEAPRAEVEPEAGESGSFWNSILPWRGGAADVPDEEPAPEPEPPTAQEPEVEADAWPAAEHPWTKVDEAQPEPSAAPESEPAIEPRWPASVPEPMAEPEPADERADETSDVVRIGGGFTYDRQAVEDAPWRPEPEAGVGAAADAEPEAGPAAEAAAAPPEGEEAVDWDPGASTRVLPTDWMPPQPDGRRRGELEPSAGPIRTRLAQPDADEELDEELAAPTIAEQAVPWLIGVILLLAGMVIVLLALIFAGDGSLGGGTAASPSPTLAAVASSPVPSATPVPTTAATRSPVPSAAPEATPTPAPALEYGPLEMIYQGRSAALAPIYLLRADFTVEDQARDPTELAQDSELDVRRFAWAPDGRVGACLLADVLVSIEPGKEKRRLGDGLSTITFGDDASTVYAVRITEDGANDSATVLAIDFASGEAEELAAVTYRRPQLKDEPALAEARFSDDGGAVRLYWMADDVLRLWVLGAGAWTIAPTDGKVTELDGEPLPTLVSPNGRERIALEEEDGVTTLARLDMNDRARAETTIDGVVSHVRWSPLGDRVVFTLGRSAPGGGVLQDLFLWDLANGEAPVQLTSTGAAFGAEWVGTQPRWRD